MRPPRSYAALGDSLSAGFEGDVAEPWPGQVARALAAGGPALEFRNLAVAGATSIDVAVAQVDAAVAMEPDLISLICGANDVLLSVRPDPQLYAGTLEELLSLLRRRVPDALIVMATYPELATFLPLRERSRERVRRGIEAVNGAISELSLRHGTICLDWASHPGVNDAENFAEDAFHPSPIGHRRAAAAFLDGLRAELPLPGVALPPESTTNEVAP